MKTHAKLTKHVVGVISLSTSRVQTMFSTGDTQTKYCVECMTSRGIQLQALRVSCILYYVHPSQLGDAVYLG